MSKKSIKHFKWLRLSSHLIVGLFALLVFTGLSQKATAQLAKGDIAFTAFNADEDGWSLVSFVDIPANTIIYFTDNEATGTTSFNTGESYFQWNTGSNAIQAGTVVRFSSVDLTSLASSVGTLTRASVSGNTNYGLSGSGDVVYAFQGNSVTSPSLILAAISSGDVVSPGDVITNAGLTSGTNAIVLRTSADYGEYNGTRAGQTSFANYKSLVFGVANWTVDQNDGTYTTTVPNITAFTILPVIPTVELSVSTNTASEAAQTIITVTATASAVVSGDQTISLGVSGTGITTEDYTISNTTLTIPNGSTTGSITFTIVDDAGYEGDETAVLTISNPSSGITLGITTTENIIITDNDPAPIPAVNLTVSATNASEASASVVTVTATSAFAVTGDQTISLAVTGTGITAADYTLSNTTITIPSGSTEGTVSFTITDDAIYEGTETAIITISDPSVGITLGSTTIQNIDITDNDVALEVDLSKYVRVGRYDLPEPTRTAPPANSLLAQEVSAVTYNWDTQTLFVVGDGGTSVVQVSKTGQLINSMTLSQGSSPQGTEFYDPEGLTYVGNGQFVMSEERDRQAVLFTYVAGTTLTRSATQTVKLGTFVQNIGIEGISYDPLTNGYICVKEKTPQGIFQTGIDFNAGTATNGSSTTENSINLFDPALTNTLDFADVFALSNLPALNGQPNYGNLIVLSQESGKIINVDRTGNISSSLTIISDPGNPLDVPGQQHEGLTMDRDGNLYVVSENGGGDFDHPQLWVYAPSLVSNQPPTALTLSNTTNTIEENTTTLSPIKVADIVVTDDGLGNNNLTVTGADAAFFEITGFGLFIKAGTVLDYETKTSYSITINADDPTVGNTPDATTIYSLNLTDVVNETPQLPAIIISEVAPWSSGNSPVAADWFEVTNTTNSAIDITGWKMDDNSNSFATSVALNGITSIAAGESVIFIETADLPGKSAAFLSNWFGANPPAGLHIGSYTGSGVGLSSGGDAVNLFNSAGVLQANVTFGASPAGPFPTFNNAAGLNNAAVSQLSSIGVNGAFAAVNSTTEVGSPGSIGKLFISEVAPWSSGNSPVAADWFEITNTLATAVDITGWKIDDNSGSFAASVALNGITSIAPGESVIFIETADLPGKSATFLSNWFGANPPANLKIGSYSGSSVGLSSGGDAVNLYNSTGILQASVIFGASSASAPFNTFDNAAGLNNTTITQLSATGTNGAFVASADANEIGSPGTIVNKPCSGSPTSSTTNVTICALQLPYNWNGIDRISAGTYTYNTTNVAGCDSVATLILTVNEATSSSTSVAVCASQLPYSWNGINRTEAGIYTFTTMNAAGCDSVATLILTVNEATSSSTSVAVCASQLPYSWNGIDRNEAGTYTYTTTNSNGCDSVATLILSVNEATSSSTSVAICASALPYNWNGIDRNEAGTYTYTTTNSNGCDSVATLILTVNPSPVASATAAGTIICNGGSTSVTVSATGGVAPYTGTGTFAVAAGSYNYTVTDANNCSASTSITVTQPNPIVATVNTGTISCFGGRVSATVTATGGSSSYKYKINNKKLQISNVFNNLAAGSYLVTVFDSEGCSGSVSFTITQPTKLSLVGVQKIKPSCKGGTNGLIQVSGVGGTGAYQYSINNGALTSSGVFNNLHAGTYTISVIDANGCTASLFVILVDGKGACTGAIAPVENQEPGYSIQISGNKPQLKIMAVPNPTTTSFTLTVQSSSNEEVQITVTDMMGKKMYSVKGSANQQFKFGSSFTSGMYIVQVVQGKNIQTLKIIKGKG